MKTNVGTVDRVIRVVVGLVILGVGLYCQSWWGLIGLLPIATAILRFCPGYLPFRINTCGEKTAAPTPPPPQSGPTTGSTPGGMADAGSV
ncbi:MAG TPA: DUF2892 domain-containing protein [Opitutaceae bacterium]|nr:DUF2892 domain-containing protein [Opitutaceae bacterium]